MSKHMQLTVHIQAYYQGGFRAVYPVTARALKHPDRRWAAEDPSLFDIVGKLDNLLYELEGNRPFRKTMLKHRTELLTLHKEIQGDIADRQLAEADQKLYRMEDIFDEIEQEMSRDI